MPEPTWTGRRSGGASGSERRSAAGPAVLAQAWQQRAELGQDVRRRPMSLDGEFVLNEAASKREPVCKAAAQSVPQKAPSPTARIRRAKAELPVPS